MHAAAELRQTRYNTPRTQLVEEIYVTIILATPYNYSRNTLHFEANAMVVCYAYVCMLELHKRMHASTFLTTVGLVWDGIVCF